MDIVYVCALSKGLVYCSCLLQIKGTSLSFILFIFYNFFFIERPWFLIYVIVELLHSFTITQSHWSPSGLTVCLSPRGAVVRVLGVHPHFWNKDSSVSKVSLHWWPRRDLWSLASIGSLTLATGCFSHPSCPSSILTASHRLMRHTAGIL
jgi:hypothetical protein